jgi:hypothetical protein
MSQFLFWDFIGNSKTRDESWVGLLAEGHALCTKKHKPDESGSPVKPLLSHCNWSVIYRAFICKQSVVQPW